MIDINDPNIRQIYIDHATKSLELVQHGRSYALSADSALALAAYAVAWQAARAEQGKSFTRAECAKELLEPLAKIETSLRQQRPAEEDALPEMPIDPVTKAQMANPFAKATENLNDQMLLTKKDPKLADHLKAIANGVTFGYLNKLAEEKAQRQAIRDIVYTKAEDALNPFHGGPKDNLQARGEFVKKHPPHVVKFWQEEAIPARLASLQRPTNLTTKSSVAKVNPQLLERAEGIYRQWVDQDLQRLKELTQQHSQELERVRQLATAR